MTPQELRSSILWSAIQGKITVQSDSESAQDVLQNINLSPLPEEECYFDIPSNWKWCKIKDIFTLVNGKAFKPTDWGQTGLPIVRIQNLNDPNAPFNYCDGTIEDKFILNGGELLFSWSGTPGTSFGAFIWNGGRAALNQHIFIVYPRFELDIKYAMYALNGELKVFIDKAHGGAGLKHITKKEFENCGLPIPPLEEQKRIVAKLEEILPLVERYEAAWNKLEEFNKRFPGDMQKSILQLAIQGKLVEQRSEEGTGEGLFQQIQAEKQALIKAGKIKKEKPLPEIAEDEIPFALPANWKLTKLGNCITLFSGSDFKPDEYNDKGNGIPYITGASSLSDSGVILNRWTDVPRILANRGDVLLVCKGSGYGKTVICDIEEAHIARQIMAIKKSDALNMEFIRYFLQANFDLIKTKGQGVIPGIDRGSVLNLAIALPPLAEQNRIVTKLKEILPLCERLK